MLNFNMDYAMLFVEYKKKFQGQMRKKMFVECCPTDTRQKGNGGTRGAMFAECRNLPSVFPYLPSVGVCRVFFSRIAECQNVC